MCAWEACVPVARFAFQCYGNRREAQRSRSWRPMLCILEDSMSLGLADRPTPRGLRGNECFKNPVASDPLASLFLILPGGWNWQQNLSSNYLVEQNTQAGRKSCAGFFLSSSGNLITSLLNTLNCPELCANATHGICTRWPDNFQYLFQILITDLLADWGVYFSECSHFLWKTVFLQIFAWKMGLWAVTLPLSE